MGSPLHCPCVSLPPHLHTHRLSPHLEENPFPAAVLCLQRPRRLGGGSHRLASGERWVVNNSRGSWGRLWADSLPNSMSGAGEGPGSTSSTGELVSFALNQVLLGNRIPLNKESQFPCFGGGGTGRWGLISLELVPPGLLLTCSVAPWPQVRPPRRQAGNIPGGLEKNSYWGQPCAFLWAHSHKLLI